MLAFNRRLESVGHTIVGLSKLTNRVKIRTFKALLAGLDPHKKRSLLPQDPRLLFCPHPRLPLVLISV